MEFPKWMGEHPRANVPWTPEECEILREAFNNGESINTIAARHGRSNGGIESKLFSLLGENFWIIQHRRSIDPEVEARRLSALGYCKTSNKHRLVSRIDNPDWLKVLAKSMNLAVADFYTPDGKMSSSWPDHYRRVYSKDSIEVPTEVLKFMPTSSHNTIGYIDPTP